MKRELVIDLGDGVGVACRIAATARFPGPAYHNRPVAVMFAFPGGGYARGYFDLSAPGYSQAVHHTERGILFIACDPLGTGGSTIETNQPFALETIAATNAAAVAEIMRRLRTGSLAEGVPAMPGNVPLIGIGQSMGGTILLLTQWRHRSFDAVAMLGSSAIQNVIPQRTQALTAATRAVFETAAAPHLELPADDAPPPEMDLRYAYHWEDVPQALLDADMGNGYPVRRIVPEWGSATLPQRSTEVMLRGRAAMSAASIKVPVLIVLGERDVAAAPHAEPAAYEASPDVSLFIVPRMAHMHNFAGTRRVLWDRLVAWTNLIRQEVTVK
jgi:pimeloyl-ACP methyl ester carboxylesterase